LEPLKKHMRDSRAYHKMKDLVGKYAGNISVLEEEIDIELQMQYFKESKQCKREINRTEVLDNKDVLFDEKLSYEAKRTLLCQLASIDDVSAYRSIEKYALKPDSSLEEWSKLAFQESKMLLQSTFLDKAPLFISTGLGGKGTNLRYFIVVSSVDYKPFTEVQKGVVQSEFEFGFKKAKAEIEEIQHCSFFTTITGLIPIETGLKDLFRGIIMSCNELGGFLNTSFLVTNVKKLSHDEIEKSIEKERLSKLPK